MRAAITAMLRVASSLRQAGEAPVCLTRSCPGLSASASFAKPEFDRLEERYAPR